MGVTITSKPVAEGDRYRYDFGICTPSNGWAQVDTDRDASYFGVWANPFSFTVVSYVEGEEITVRADTPEEFVDYLRKLDRAYRGVKLDPGVGSDAHRIVRRFVRMGVADLIHEAALRAVPVRPGKEEMR